MIITNSKVIMVGNPVAKAALTELRDKRVSGAEFRRASDCAASFLAQRVSSEIEQEFCSVVTPLAEMMGHTVCDEKVVLAPVIRAGEALLAAFWTVMPAARVHHIGIERDEQDASPHSYYPRKGDRRIKPGEWAILLDPMLATGGSAAFAIESLKRAGASRISFANVIASQEGIDLIAAKFPDVTIYTLAVDPTLNAQKYIVPGLGDYGDRYFGT